MAPPGRQRTRLRGQIKASELTALSSVAACIALFAGKGPASITHVTGPAIEKDDSALPVAYRAATLQQWGRGLSVADAHIARMAAQVDAAESHATPGSACPTHCPLACAAS